MSKHIKIQQREIDQLIDEKVKEMKNSKINKKKTVEIEEKEDKKDQDLTEGNKLKRTNVKKVDTKIKEQKKIHAVKNESLLPEIEKKIKNIKSELIELTIDNTQKYIKEKNFGLHKNLKKNSENNDEKKDNKNKQNQELVFEDLPYEKEIKDYKEKDKKHKQDLLKKKKV